MDDEICSLLVNFDALFSFWAPAGSRERLETLFYRYWVLGHGPGGSELGLDGSLPDGLGETQRGPGNEV